MTRDFHEMPRAQQAGIRCHDRDFQEWLGVPGKYLDTPRGADFAAHIVRGQCGIDSRAELATDNDAAIEWDLMLKEYEEREPFTSRD
jgi:hypothetical protein